MLPALGSCSSLSEHDNEPKHTSKMTTALLRKLKVKVMDWSSISPDLNPIEHLWGILKWKVEEHKVSDIHQLHEVIMEGWKWIPAAILAALVNSMPKRDKARCSALQAGHRRMSRKKSSIFLLKFRDQD